MAKTWGTYQYLGDCIKVQAVYTGGHDSGLAKAFAGTSRLGNPWPPPLPHPGESAVDYYDRTLGDSNGNPGQWTNGEPFMVSLGGEIQGDLTSVLNDWIGAFTAGQLSFSDLLNAAQNAATVRGTNTTPNAAAIGAGKPLAAIGAARLSPAQTAANVRAATARAQAAKGSSSGAGTLAMVAGAGLLLFLLTRR